MNMNRFDWLAQFFRPRLNGRPRREKHEKKQPVAWRWERYRCIAHTKSEARATFNRIADLPRLPIGANVVQAA